jgi:cob(I)alamin adenosyltransferase
MPFKMYTRSGDKGETSLFGGIRVKKTDQRVVAYGCVDELNSLLGVVRSVVAEERVKQLIFKEQRRLFKVGADLATPLSVKTPKPIERISDEDIRELEEEIDALNVKPINAFVVPGSSQPSAYLHYARAVARRAEREVWKLLESGADANPKVAVYLNRLSSLLFVAALYVNESSGVPEDKWP